MAALPYIRGEFTVFMDDDGQHPAEGIFSLVEKLSEGYDAVYARFPSQKETLFRRLASRMTNICMTAVTKKPADLKITSFFAVSKFATQALLQYQSPYVFLGGYLFEITGKITSVEISHRDRLHGKSTYTFKKLYSMWLDNMLAFPAAPSKMCRRIGISAVFLALVLFTIAVLKLSGTLAVSGLISFGFGLLFIMTGILGEILLRSFNMMQGVPAYMIRDTTAHDIHGNGPSDP